MTRDKNSIFPAGHSTMDSRGRITLPLTIRKHLQAEAGSRLTFTPECNGTITISVLPHAEPTARHVDTGLPETEASRALAIDTTADLVRQGHLVSAAEFQALMGWSTRQALRKALSTHRLFAMTLHSRSYFPRFFADPIYDRRQLEAVSKQLGTLPGGAKLQFFITPKGSLAGMTALEALAAGQLEKVLRVAAAFAER